MSVSHLQTLVLGLGNPILTDDGVGIHVTRAVASRLAFHPDLAGCPTAVPGVNRDSTGPGDLRSGVRFSEASVGGLRLLEVLAGYDRVILVDAIQTPDGLPGDICQLSPGDVRSSLHAGSTHDLSLQGALAWGRQTGMALPDDDGIRIVAVETRDVLTFGESCTPEVATAVPRAVELVLGMLGDLKT